MSDAMPRLRPYQATVARAVLERVFAGEGGSISVEIARQGGKNELSAQLELVLLLAYAERGGTAVKCAPTLVPQARISHRRLRERAARGGVARAVVPAPGAIRCGRAEVRFLSAEPTANVVGHTASLLLEVDEAQDVDVEKFDRDFRPMAASTNAPVIFYGTPWGPRSLLARARAEHLEQERRDGRRRHFRYDWQEVARHVPAYAAYVEGERQRLGERHPLFRTQYCLDTLADADRMFDRPTLAQIEGDHARLRQPQGGERYVAGLDLAGADRPADGAGPAAPRRRSGGDRDWTVLTIARVRDDPNGLPRIDVVEQQAWQGEATEPLVATLADRLRRVWRARRVAVDATGLGGPIAELLERRLPTGVLDPVVFTRERKSALGFGLLAAAHSGRLRLYAADGSPERAECDRQLELARASYPDMRTIRFHVDPQDGHDDYLMSLALTVAAAGGARGGRTARGRSATGGRATAPGA